MELRVTHNLPAAKALFARYGRQIPYATAVALNKTALDAQRYEQNWILRSYTIRSRFWMSRQVKHKPRANKVQQWTRLSIDPPGGKRRADILGKFEKGGRKTPRRGKHIAIPVEAKRTGSGKIRANQRIKGFNFRRVGNTIQGDKRTFIIESGASAGIYQRIGARRKKRAKAGQGRGKGKVNLLYAFARSVPIDNRLQFVSNITRIARKQFAGRFHNAWRQALRTAR